MIKRAEQLLRDEQNTLWYRYGLTASTGVLELLQQGLPTIRITGQG